jgi:hypothetical protein
VYMLYHLLLSLLLNSCTPMHIQLLWLPFVVRRVRVNRLEVCNGARALAAKR